MCLCEDGRWCCLLGQVQGVQLVLWGGEEVG